MKVMTSVAPRVAATVGYMLLRSTASSALAAASAAGLARTTRGGVWMSGSKLPRVTSDGAGWMGRGGGSSSDGSINGPQRRDVSTTSSSLSATKMDQSFPTWSFDKPCSSMEWTTINNVTLSLATEKDTLEDADLVLIGVAVPPKKKSTSEANDSDEEEDDSNDETAPTLTGFAQSVDQALKGALSDMLVETKKTFKQGAKAGAFTPTLRPIGGAAKAKRYALWGLGTASKEEDDGMGDTTSSSTAAAAWTTTGLGRSLGKALADRFASDKSPIRTVHVALPASLIANATLVCDLATALYQELVSDNRYRTGDKIKYVAPDLKSIVLFADTDSDASMIDADAIDAALTRGKQLAAGVLLTKDIVNAPHNVLNSESLAETAKRIAKEHASVLSCQVLGQKECEARGMGAYLGVARGSETEPQFIHLTYTPPKRSSAKNNNRKNKVVGVVGKGLLFDTGGYNIKTAMMEQMKFDCGGAAAVLGAARAIGALQPPNVEVHFIVAACENMINQKAMVPSDILTASNGKTIEVLNTDAEGRLTLADALVFADTEVHCESIIELSTLTGACMVALGKQVSGVWTHNDCLAAELADVSRVTGDMSWRMPLVSDYAEDLESKIADLKNIGGKYGGSITAALFLQNFVNKKKPFAHIDMAGPVWSDKTGATGYGAKLIVEWVTRQGKSDEQ